MVTHQMEEVERLCDRVILLKDGGAEAYGSIDEVQEQYGGTTIRLKYAGDLPPSPRYAVTVNERNYAELAVVEQVDEAVILRELLEAGVIVRSFATGKPSLEDIFVQVYGEQTELAGPI
jgi:ABC-2 type transport system ATP-binding protein